jgi:hypothetical protein
MIKNEITITIESADGNKFVKKIKADGFRVIGDNEDSQKVAKPAGTGAGVYLPISSIGNRVIIIELLKEE